MQREKNNYSAQAFFNLMQEIWFLKWQMNSAVALLKDFCFWMSNIVHTAYCIQPAPLQLLGSRWKELGH